MLHGIRSWLMRSTNHGLQVRMFWTFALLFMQRAIRRARDNSIRSAGALQKGKLVGVRLRGIVVVIKIGIRVWASSRVSEHCGRLDNRAATVANMRRGMGRELLAPSVTARSLTGTSTNLRLVIAT